MWYEGSTGRKCPFGISSLVAFTWYDQALRKAKSSCFVIVIITYFTDRKKFW
jgi:hypothetical protein